MGSYASFRRVLVMVEYNSSLGVFLNPTWPTTLITKQCQAAKLLTGTRHVGENYVQIYKHEFLCLFSVAHNVRFALYFWQ
jgi:hypothetical protein